jgi:hypothetical protein
MAKAQHLLEARRKVPTPRPPGQAASELGTRSRTVGSAREADVALPDAGAAAASQRGGPRITPPACRKMRTAPSSVDEPALYTHTGRWPSKIWIPRGT